MGWRSDSRCLLHIAIIAVFGLVLVVACSGPTGNASQSPEPADAVQEQQPPLSGEAETEEAGPIHHSSFGTDIPVFGEWQGDLDGMAERQVVRALVVYSLTNYFLDGPTQRGVTYEALKEFEKYLNKQLGRRTLKVHVVIIPVRRDELLPALVQGLGDIAASNLTITPERQAKVAFSSPLASGVSELIINAPGSPIIETRDQLSGTEIHARRSSSYWESLQSLNADLTSRGLARSE